MSLITLDFETYYDKDFSLSKLTTEEYVRDPRFEVIGVGIKVDDGQTEWFAGEDVAPTLRQLDWADSAVLCHNTMFDGAILAWRYNIIPAMYFDTLCMARALHGVNAGGSLKALASRYGIGEKGDEVINALGKRLCDFDSESLARYAGYCKNDVELTYALFIKLQPFPEDELNLIDMTLRMYTQPVLQVNDAALITRLDVIREKKAELLKGLMFRLECATEEEVRKKLCSNPQFAQVLRDFGIAPPMKVSIKTGKNTYAFAKTDEGFITLQDHEDPFIQQLCAVRLGTKSTLEESRIERFIEIGSRNRTYLPVPLRYYGAHTGRWSGLDAINFQNLPSRDKAKKALKNAVVAPDGHIVINCDSSQIEARVLAWLAGQNDVTEQFGRGEDVYSIFASKIYKKKIDKSFPTERFVGKTCLAAGTRILTRRGWVDIVDVSPQDQLWDGVEWVNHCGVSFMGVKPIIRLSGVELTHDHEILTDHTKWESAEYVLTHDTAFQSALNLATLSLLGISSIDRPILNVVGDGNRFVNALDAIAKIFTQDITLEQVDQLRAIAAPNAKQVISVGGSINQLCKMIYTVLGCSTDCLLQLRDVILRQIVTINTTGREELAFLSSGEMIVQNSCGMYKLSMGGTTQSYKWTVSMLMETMSRTISGLFPLVKICTTKEKSRTSKPVFDILNSGLRNRFTILTEHGPIIVHNCILGLGYGTGAQKLQHTLKTSPPGADLALQECQDIVNLYRTSNDKITGLWRECDLALKQMMGGASRGVALGNGAITYDSKGIRLPNGLYIRYPNLRLNGEGKTIYDSRKGEVNIWGGAMVENIVQALARIVVGKQMLWVAEHYRPVLTVHDAVVCVVPENEVKDALEYIMLCMSTPPSWAEGLPVACEAKYGQSYGDC
jgi:DNA polymerase I-like protein with 3'-5' exonuclease and polymerase domains